MLLSWSTLMNSLSWKKFCFTYFILINESHTTVWQDIWIMASWTRTLATIFETGNLKLKFLNLKTISIKLNIFQLSL